MIKHKLFTHSTYYRAGTIHGFRVETTLTVPVPPTDPYVTNSVIRFVRHTLAALRVRTHTHDTVMRGVGRGYVSRSFLYLSQLSPCLLDLLFSHRNHVFTVKSKILCSCSKLQRTP